MRSRRAFITGTAGFIGFHLAKHLLEHGWEVRGYDGMTMYYDVELKRNRHRLLLQYEGFTTVEAMLEEQSLLDNSVDEFKPDIIVHLAAQAGVRYSLENPRAYIDSNITGTFHVLEAARRLKVEHLLMASTSSVYGANTAMPFKESDRADTQLTMYAATKKANESMAHAYANLWNIPTTMCRFFTVYGPWGRPDLALFKFVSAILEDRPIDIYNHGHMYRDFTYIDDLVEALRLVADKPPEGTIESVGTGSESDSTAAPYRVINIGNSTKVKLLDFIDTIEDILDKKAIRTYLPMQMGDVPATWADTTQLRQLTGCEMGTDIHKGISRFIEWYLEYYQPQDVR